MKNVLAEITRLRLERGWNEYELAKHCGLSQSTKMVPIERTVL